MSNGPALQRSAFPTHRTSAMLYTTVLVTLLVARRPAPPPKNTISGARAMHGSGATGFDICTSVQQVCALSALVRVL